MVNHLKTLRDSMIDPSPRIYLMPMEMVLMSLKRSKVKERKKNPRVRKARREQLQTMMMTINRSSKLGQVRSFKSSIYSMKIIIISGRIKMKQKIISNILIVEWLMMRCSQ